MKVGLVCPYDLRSPGGVQAQVMGLQETLTGLGHEVSLMAPGAPGIDVGRVRRVRANQSVAPLALGPRVGRKVRAVLAGCDVLHVHEPFMPSVSWAAVGMDAPRVATFHAAPTGFVLGVYGVAAPIGRRRLGRAEVTAVSEVAAQGPARMGLTATVIPNGISLPDAVGDQAHRRGVVFIGRDEPRKGLAVLLEAWPDVLRTCPEATLTIIGTSGRAGQGVRYLGSITDQEKARVLADAAVLCAPNLGGESFGIVVAEGMAAGCAVVCSDLPAFLAVGADGVATFPVGEPAALAHTLTKLLGDTTTRAALAQRGRARATRFSMDAVTDEYLAAYDRARRA